MGFKSFNKAVAILKGDFYWLLLNSFGDSDLTPEELRRRLTAEVVKLGLWIWDTFNFETMTVPEAIEMESEKRVIYAPISEIFIPSPGVGYSIVDDVTDGYHYKIIVNDSVNPSSFATSIQQKFKMGEPSSITEYDGVYSYFYDLYVASSGGE